MNNQDPSISIQTHRASLESTGDGSTTLFSEPFQQPYHNRGGAASESGYLFLEMTGLTNAASQEDAGEATTLHILEIGFGTGLNMALLYDKLHHDKLLNGKLHDSRQRDPVSCHFYSVEGFPPNPSLLENMEYGVSADSTRIAGIIQHTLHYAKPGWNDVVIEPSFHLHLLISRFEEFASKDTLSEKIPPINLFFHDPFSPETNPSGWTPELFRRLRKLAAEDALLSTYSASSRARASMATAGWYVARAPGALNKREMTLASPNPDRLKSFKRVNESRLAERLRNGDFSETSK